MLGRLWTTAIFVVALTAPIEARTLATEEKSLIEDAVKEVLKDPDSARFKWNGYAEKDTYCGQINSKNSMGGYVGFRTFMVDLTTKDGRISAVRGRPMILEPGHDDALLNACQNYTD